MMQFRTIKNALVDLLAANAAGRFRVVGAQSQGVSASEIKGVKRAVQVFYSVGKFPGSAGGYGSRTHTMMFTVGLYVSAAAKADLSAINTVGATHQQVSAALAALQESSAVADLLWDELAEIVFQIISDGKNQNLGLPIGNVASLWISDIVKEDPVPAGSLVALEGRVVVSLNTSEDVTGDTPTVASDITTALSIFGDGVQKTGVTVGSVLQNGIIVNSPSYSWMVGVDDQGNATLQSVDAQSPSPVVVLSSPDGTEWVLGADDDGNITLTSQ